MGLTVTGLIVGGGALSPALRGPQRLDQIDPPSSRSA